MKRVILAGLASLCLSAIPLSVGAVQTIDAPHVNLDSNADTEDCALCHFSADAYSCQGCHSNSTGSYTDLSAPLAFGHVGLQCQTCHNPHVSHQYGTDTPLVAGQIDSVLPSGNSITFGYSGTLTGDWAALPPASWASKTGVTAPGDPSKATIDRGLTLWVTEGTNSYSFEVTAADATSITVKGGLPAGESISAPNTFELHYGQLMAKAVSPTGVSYRGADPVAEKVTFPAWNNTGAIAGNVFVNSVGDGVCQTCHQPYDALTDTGTIFWDNSGADVGHNSGKPCVECHKHGNNAAPAYGFGLGEDCWVCHENYGPSSPGEPPLSGAHLTHAGHDVSKGQYGFDCKVCHKTGMENWNIASTKDKIVQLGFNLIPNQTIDFSGANTSYDGVPGTLSDASKPADQVNYGDSYLGGNDTIVTENGTMTCSNVYCHSDGYAAGYNEHPTAIESPAKCTTSTASSRSAAVSYPNVTPPWTGSWLTDDPQGDGNKCNNCHDVASGIGVNTNGYTHHDKHVVENSLACTICHYATVATADNSTISPGGLAYHANGQVDLKANPTIWADGLVEPKFNWDPVNKTCGLQGFNFPCHNSPNDKPPWQTLNGNKVFSGGLVLNPADDISCETVAATPNVDPIAVPFNPATDAWIYENDLYTVHFTAKVADYDNLDPVKKAASGNTGNNNKKGTMVVNYSLGERGQMGPLRVTDNQTTFRFSKTFDKAAVDSKNGKMCFKWVYADNGFQNPNGLSSYQNLLNANWLYPGPDQGIIQPVGIPGAPGFDCVFNTDQSIIVKDDYQNIKPVVTFDPTAPGAITFSGANNRIVTVTYTARDADADDPAKKAYWAAQTGGNGGHSLDTKYYHVFNWASEGATDIRGPVPAMTATDAVYSQSFDFTGTAKDALGRAWVEFAVCDNHFWNVDMDYDEHCYKSGFFKVTFP